jgi:hypothetical protein
MKTPIYVSIYGKGGKAFDLGIYKPSEIIDKIKKAKVSGVLEESRMLEQGKLIVENIEINPGINPKLIKERPDWFFNVDRVKQ